jgi:hypothetical protein
MIEYHLYDLIEVSMNEQQRFQKRNEAGFLWQGIIFFFGLAFIDGNAVVPVFISAMGGSLALAGLASAVHVAPSILMQLFVGVQSGKIRNLPRFISILMAIAYGLPFIMAALLITNIATSAALVLFLVLYAMLWAGDGSLVIGWYDLFGRVCDPRRRGLVFGRQQLFGGFLALGGSYVVRLVLGAEAIPVRSRYAILFTIAAVAMSGSAIAMAFVRDVPHRVMRHDSFLKQISAFPALFKESKLFRRMTAVQALQGVAVMSLPILVLFSKQTFSIPLAMTGWLVTAQITGSLSGGYIWGAVSHRLGNNRVIQLNQCNILLIVSLAIVSALTGASPMAYVLAFLSGITFSCWMAYPNYIIDIVSESQRPQYLVMSSLVGLPFTFMPYVAGLLADKFGFIAVFILCCAAVACSLVLSLRLSGAEGHMEVQVMDSAENQ